MNKILLIDGNSLVYRAYYGSAYGPAGILTNSKGIPVNAVSVFNRMITKATTKYNPTHIFVAFDAGKKTLRHDKLDSYKGGRKQTPPELITQFPIVKEMLDAIMIKHFEIPGIEADDIIGTLAHRFANNNEVFVLSSDKDLYQLVMDNVVIISPQNGNKEDKVINQENFYDINGFMPYQVADMKGLTGDSSDNLPGVRGIGDKGAIKLLEKYNTLENIYEHIDEHSTSLKNKLIESREIAFLCKELATLAINIDIPFELNDLGIKNGSVDSAISFFKKYEINSLVRKYEKLKKVSTEKEKDNSQISFENLFL